MGLDNLDFHANVHQLLPTLILYIGPETMLPLTSAVAAIVGVLLMFWQRFIVLLRKILRLMIQKDG